MKKLALLALLLLLPCTAFAQGTVHSGTYGFESVDAGVFEIGLDNMLLVNYSSADLDPDGNSTLSRLRASYVGGITPRYFVAKNFSVALNLNLFITQENATTKVEEAETTVESGDFGFLGMAMANYYIRLGNSFFFKPGIGGGVFFGTRSRPGAEEGVKLESSLSGGAARLDLGLVYYVSSHFNLKAGIDALMWFGSETDSNDVSLGYTNLDAGFNVGVAYSF
ncbi:MAG: outer membrane beta-barrel protein [Myxococcota bacterium]|jgi:hypothetical protein|nr:outer membrane beta-barrel protein [Myxococcota bacterium]